MYCVQHNGSQTLRLIKNKVVARDKQINFFKIRKRKTFGGTAALQSWEWEVQVRQAFVSGESLEMILPGVEVWTK